MRKKKCLKNVMKLLLSLLILSCSDDDDKKLEAWEVEVIELKELTSKYADFSLATDEDFVDISGYVPNMGYHYLNPALSDGTFDIDKPEIILYVPDEDGVMQMVGVEYSIIPEDPENPGSPPEGFTGDEDVWNFNEAVGQWQLHVWTVLENPEGVFVAYNLAIGD